MSDTIVQGGCLCGKIRYSFKLSKSLDKMHANFCHCTMCRKGSGSTIAAFIEVPREDVTIDQGEIKQYQSSKTCLRGFCGDCGSQLTWQDINDGTLDFCLGTLDHEYIYQVKPKYQVWCENKIFPISDDIPKYTQNSKTPLYTE
ncbi:unnamed protein product [Cunninghamella blakesleeana]